MVPSLAEQGGGSVRIVKIAFDPPGADNGSNASLNEEYVLIKNFSAHGVQLSNASLQDASGHVFLFPGINILLGPGRTLKVHTGRGTNSTIPMNFYWDADGYVWNNDGDTATLRRATGDLIDRCSYSGSGSTATC